MSTTQLQTKAESLVINSIGQRPMAGYESTIKAESLVIISVGQRPSKSNQFDVRPSAWNCIATLSHRAMPYAIDFRLSAL